MEKFTKGVENSAGRGESVQELWKLLKRKKDHLNLQTKFVVEQRDQLKIKLHDSGMMLKMQLSKRKESSVKH